MYAESGRRGQVAGVAREGWLVPAHVAGDVADEDLSSVGVVARVDESPARVTRQALRHRLSCKGVVGAADDEAFPVGWETGVAVLVGLVLVFTKRVHRVADGPPVGFGQPVCEYLALEDAHVARVEVLAEQVVGLHPVLVDQDDVGLPSPEESVEALGDESARPAAAHHRDPGGVQHESVVPEDVEVVTRPQGAVGKVRVVISSPRPRVYVHRPSGCNLVIRLFRRYVSRGVHVRRLRNKIFPPRLC